MKAGGAGKSLTEMRWLLPKVMAIDNARSLRAGHGAPPGANSRGGMKLPNARLAIVPERKLTHYLLDPAHPAGGSKARFFLQSGFRSSDWQRLSAALRKQAQEHEVIEAEETPHGTRYVIDGKLEAPDGARLNVRSVWYIHLGRKAPRFVTAHPLPRR